MINIPNYITPQGFKALQEEFKKLFHNERPRLVETVSWAAGNGDRSENSDYIYGKKRLREIDRRLRFLSQRIERAQIIDPKTLKSDRVVFGATVTLIDKEGEEKVYMIVGEDEIDLSRGKISWKSPVAKALLNKQIGDEVLIKKPNSESSVEILKIQFL